MCVFYNFLLKVVFQSNSTVVGKDAWYDFSFLKFIKVFFMARNVIYPVDYSNCAWEECVFCCFWLQWCINIKSIWSIVSFKACVSLLIFCLNIYWCNWGVTVPTIIMLPSSSFITVSVCLIYGGIFMLDAYIFAMVIFFGLITWLLCSILVCLFILNIFCKRF